MKYHAEHDLFSHHTTDAGPSRTTRRAQNEISQSIKGSGASIPKPKARKSLNNDARGLPTETKNKGKGQQSGLSTYASGKEPSTSISVNRKGKGKALPAEDTLQDEINEKRVLLDASPIPIPRKKRKTVHTPSEDEMKSSQLPPPENLSSGLRGGRTRLSQRTAEVPEPQPIEGPKPFLRKIKLIVRKPPPAFSHPQQKPPPPSFNGSIPDFLSSYISLHRGKDVDIPTLEALAKRNAAIYSKRDRLRKEGRLFIGFDPGSSTKGGEEGPSRKDDVWDSIVGAVASRDRVQDIQQRQLVIGQIVTGLKAYWGVQALKEDKIRALEEKRLRGLAKETIKLVVNEWKRAVLVSGVG